MVAQRKVQERLRAELDAVVESIASLKAEAKPQELEGFGDNTPLSEDIDSTNSIEAKENDARRLDQLLDRAAALDAALRRAERRIYGKCIDCGEPIAPKRLESIPEAARCIDCQQRHEDVMPATLRAARWSEAAELYEQRAVYQEMGFPRRPPTTEESEGLTHIKARESKPQS